jgi:hypothetical protein
MKLAFKRKYGFGFVEKEVPIILNLGTLEAVCKALKIEFWQITEVLKKNDFDFIVELLYQGHISAYKEILSKLSRLELRLGLIPPKYGPEKAVIWKEYMSQTAQKEFTELMTVLFGELTKSADKKKEKANPLS